MKSTFREAADRVLSQTVDHRNGLPGAPGVVAMATDRKADFYEGAAGLRELGTDRAMTTDTVFAVFSCTKAITGVAVMQLVEGGTIKLDDPASKYVPELAEARVLEGFDAAGEPRTRPARGDITVSHLLLHTAGFGYDFFNHDLARYGQKKNVPLVVAANMASLSAPLLFDPGERWEYGTNIDWAGKVVEGATGKRLGEVMAERIFAPLGMNDSAFTMTPSMAARRASMHARAEDGTLSAMPDFVLPQEPEQHMGGHGLYATIGDYTKFIRMVLNDGAGTNGRVLKPETVQLMARNALGPLKIKSLPGAIPSLSNEAEFFPGMPKSWGYTWMINDEQAPTGRPAGQLAWAGLANLYYWIDRQSGIGGMWGTQILPFIDGVSVPGYLDFEKAVYDNLD